MKTKCECTLPCCSPGLRAYALWMAGNIIAEHARRVLGRGIDLGELNAAICLDKWHQATDPRPEEPCGSQ